MLLIKIGLHFKLNPILVYIRGSSATASIINWIQRIYPLHTITLYGDCYQGWSAPLVNCWNTDKLQDRWHLRALSLASKKENYCEDFVEGCRLNWRKWHIKHSVYVLFLCYEWFYPAIFCRQPRVICCNNRIVWTFTLRLYWPRIGLYNKKVWFLKML